MQAAAAAAYAAMAGRNAALHLKPLPDSYVANRPSSSQSPVHGIDVKYTKQLSCSSFSSSSTSSEDGFIQIIPGTADHHPRQLSNITQDADETGFQGSKPADDRYIILANNDDHWQVALSKCDSTSDQRASATTPCPNSSSLSVASAPVLLPDHNNKPAAPALVGVTDHPPLHHHHLIKQTLPVQTMERYTVPDPNRIPSSIFARSSTPPAEWSIASNDSLFSIHIGKSGDLGFYSSSSQPVDFSTISGKDQIVTTTITNTYSLATDDYHHSNYQQSGQHLDPIPDSYEPESPNHRNKKTVAIGPTAAGNLEPEPQLHHSPVVDATFKPASTDHSEKANFDETRSTERLSYEKYNNYNNNISGAYTAAAAQEPEITVSHSESASRISDSSATSFQSFAFPILQSAGGNASPRRNDVKVAHHQPMTSGNIYSQEPSAQMAAIPDQKEAPVAAQGRRWLSLFSSLSFCCCCNLIKKPNK